MTIEIGKAAYIDGRDPNAVPPLTLNKILLRNGVSNLRVVWSLKHGTKAKILDRAFNGIGKQFYYVRCGLKFGWVGEQFLSKEKEEPIGDLWGG